MILRLKGKHNQYNTMAAGLAASVIGYQERKDPGGDSVIRSIGTPDGVCGNDKGSRIYQ